MVLRLAVAIIAVLVGWLGRLARPRVTRQSRAASPSTSAAEAPPGVIGAPAPSAPPEDHFRHLPPRAPAPPAAAVAARSLPALGIVAALVALLLAVGATRGELPVYGPVDSASPAWAALLVTISIWAVYLLWKVPQWQAAAWARTGNADPRELFKIENESRGTLGQILSGVAVLTGLIFAWQQLGQTSDNLRVSQEGQITDRFSRAVDQLGSDQLTVRLGGIYALERIARDSPRDYGPVMEVLTAFARQESPAAAGAPATPATGAPGIPPEVRAVFKVIGRRSPAQIAAELATGDCLDLTGVNAVGADLAELDLRNTCWDRSDLRSAIISRANLTGTTFTGANLESANLDRANGTGATFSNADLASANLSQANLGGADFSEADLVDAKFGGAILSDAKLATARQVTAEQIGAALTNAGTTLPPGIAVTPDF